MKRRKLDFRSFDEVGADLDRLQRGYTSSGKWNLAQCSWHLTAFFRGSLEGFSGKRPPWVLRLIAPLIMRWMLKKRRMPAGLKTGPQFEPPANLDEGREVNNFREVMARFQKHTGPLYPSMISGDMSTDAWHDMHLIHCSLHLSFLHPTAEA